MITTITLTPNIEKKVYGKNFDELRFVNENATYACGGVGIKVSQYLKQANVDTTAAYISGSKMASFFQEELGKQEIATIALETNGTIPLQIKYIDENEKVTTQNEENQFVDDAMLSLFASVLKDKMIKDCTMFEYNDAHFSMEAMASFYQMIASNSNMLICDLHPKYYEACTAKRMDVLLIDLKQFQFYMQKKDIPLSECMEVIHNELTPLAKIIVFAYAPNDFIIFYGGNVYRALSMVKLEHKIVYKEAILTAILTSLENDADFEGMCKQCVVFSIASNLSDGFKVATPLMAEKLAKSIHVYQI